jgi:hypothetical protein
MMIPTINEWINNYQQIEYFDNKYDNHDYLPVVCFWKIFFKSLEDPIEIA